jgi:hypothetical protein
MIHLMLFSVLTMLFSVLIMPSASAVAAPKKTARTCDKQDNG